MMMIFVLLTILLANLVSSQENSCLVDQNDPYVMFATATPNGAVNDVITMPVLIDRKYYNIC